MNLQEQPSIIPLVIQVQPLTQITLDTSTKVDRFVKINTIEQKQTTKERKILLLDSRKQDK